MNSREIYRESQFTGIHGWSKLTKVKTPAVLTRDWKDYFMIRFGGALQRKSPGAKHQGFFFVAESDIISNLDLFEDILKTLEIIESVNSG